MSKSVTFQAYKWESDETDDRVTIYIHGLTKKNKRVCVKIPDFKPYVYLELDSRVKWNEGTLELLYAHLRETLHVNFPVKKRVVEKRKIYYLKKAKFIWMAFNTTSAIRALERAVKAPLTIYGVGNKIRLHVHEAPRKPDECILKLLAMRKVKPAGWITAKRTTKAQLLTEAEEKFSSCDVEIVSSFIDISPAKDSNHVTNPTVVSFDIECVSGDETGNTFPKACRKEDKVICICATVAKYQDPEDKWQVYALVNAENNRACPEELPDCDKVLNFPSERALLLGWAKFITDIDPDVIISYNGLTFDDNYVSERSSLCLCWPKFSKMGRLIGKRAALGERSWSSSAYGDQKFNYIDIPGRLHIDMYPVIFKDFGNLMSYNLDFVAEHFLGQHKVDLPARDMIQMYHRGLTEDIEKIVIYCNQDTRLPMRLMKHMNSWIGLSEMANVMNVQIFDLITRGQQIRVYSQVYSLAFDLGVVCTCKWSDYRPTEIEKEFLGATVQNPQVGYWENVATYDFKSLYPTTIIAYNICFSTFVPDGEHPPKEQYHDLVWNEHCGCIHDTAVRKTKITKKICRSHHYRFYKAEIKKGIVPMLLEGLLAARSNTRKEIGALAKKLDDPNISAAEKKVIEMTMSVLDKRQNGYKVSANSVTGNTPVPCLIGQDPTDPSARFEYRTIEELGNKFYNDGYGNQVAKPDNIFVWSDNGWTRVKYIIRHRINGPLKRVLTHTGMVDCTNEHSLLTPNGEPVKPVDLNINDELMHVDLPLPDDTPKVPKYRSLTVTDIVNHKLLTIEEQEAFSWGLFYAEGTCGLYGAGSTAKTSWCIYNKDLDLLKRASNYLNKVECCEFTVKNFGEYTTVLPSGIKTKYHVYYLRARAAGIKKLVEKYRSLFYDCRKTKRLPQRIFSAPYSVRLAFFLGYYAGDGHRKLNQGVVITNKGQIGSAGLYYLMKTLGYQVSISYSRTKIDHMRLQCCTAFRNTNTNRIKRIEIAPEPTQKVLEEYAEYIYDLETENHHFAAGVGNMIVHNSMYGGFGSEFSYIPFFPAAASTTAMGRRSIQQAIDFVMEHHPDAILVYGDSVTGDTPVLLKLPSGETVIQEISRVAQNIEWTGYRDFKLPFTEPISSDIENHVVEDGAEAVMAARFAFNEGKRWSKEHKEISDLMVWTDSGWSKIKQLIRHKTNKKIYRVTTGIGTVDVTQDHSLLDLSGNPVKPVDVHNGDLLLHSFPKEFDEFLKNPNNVLGAPKRVREVFWNDACDRGTINTNNKLHAQVYWYLAKSLGYSLEISVDQDTFCISRCDPESPQAVRSVQLVGTIDDYVYDLETDSGRFQAGLGEMIVKNTDSCMLTFKSCKTLKQSFDLCEQLEKNINTIFPPPMYLELEKIYSKYFLLSKKRYVGYIVDKEGKLLSVDKKGVVIKRRDNCAYLRKLYTELIDMVMDKAPKWRMFALICSRVDDLLAGRVETDDLVITKSIKENYKAQNLPHVAVAKKMRERGKYVAAGTRVRYLFIKTDEKNAPQYRKAEDPDYYFENRDTVKIDYLYYLEKQLANPIDDLLEVKFGMQKVLGTLHKLIKKGQITTAREYFKPRFKVLGGKEN